MGVRRGGPDCKCYWMAGRVQHFALCCRLGYNPDQLDCSGSVIHLGKRCLSCRVWVVYDLHVGFWAGILCELIAMELALISLIRYGRQPKREREIK